MLSIKNLSAVVLAGGKGTRMNSETPKVLHTIKGQPMIFYSLNKLYSLRLGQVIVVVGFKAEDVKKKVLERFSPEFAYQNEPKGTGHALKCALEQINSPEVLVINGDDSAFYKIETLFEFIKSHQKGDATLSLVTQVMVEDNALGKVILDKDGNFSKLMEEWECREQRVTSDLVNCGAYIFDVEWLRANIDQIPLNSKGEYYLTELFNIASSQGKKINIFKLNNKEEWVGVNTQDELVLANKLMATI